VQRMRAEARDNGRLTTTPQQVVTMDAQDGQNAIEILPADPQVIYVPVYSPSYVWGTPVWGGYYDMWHPSGFSWGFGYGPGIYMSSYFPRWDGWGSWGWNSRWSGRSLFLNTGFFNRYGFRAGDFGRYGGFSRSRFGGRTPWTHNPGHRLGIPYPNRTVASRFNSTRFGSSGSGGDRMNRGQFAGGARSSGGQWNGGRINSDRPVASQPNRSFGGAGGGRSGALGDWQRFGGSNRSPSTGRSDGREPARSAASGVPSGNRADTGSYRQPAQNYAANGGSRSSRAPGQGFSGYGSAQGYRSSPLSGQSVSPGYSAPRSGGSSAPRSYSAPRQRYSASRPYSDPRVSGGGGSSAPRSYSTPRQSYSAPRAFSNPRVSGGGGPSVPRSYSNPRQSYSAPRASSNPRFSGGGSGSSVGNSGSSEDRSRGHSEHRR